MIRICIIGAGRMAEEHLKVFSTIKNVVNKEDQLEVEVSIRNYYLNNLVEKEVVKILS